MTVVNPITTDVPDARAHRPRPLRADAARNQKRILAAARELFAERGLDITLDDVAEHAGVGVGTVYRRFANKQELIAGVFEENVERIAEEAERAHDNPDAWSGLVDFFGYMCQHMAGNRGLGEVLVTLDNNEERFACVKERMQPAITRVIDRAKAAGELRPDAEAGDFFALIHMVDWIADFARPVNPDIWQRYFALILDGLRCETKRRQALPGQPLTDEEIHVAKTACFSRKR